MTEENLLIVNFYRLYGTYFFTINTYKVTAVYYANTTEDYINRLNRDNFIPSDHSLTDKEARAWLKKNYPHCEIHKVDKHYHTEWHAKEDRMGD